MSAPSDTVSAGSARTTRFVIYTLLLVLAVIYLLPLYVMLTTSFKSLAEIRAGDMLALPRAPSLDAWFKAWGDACIGVTCEGIKGYFWNSLKMVVPAVLISTVLGALNGYVLTKWRFPGHKLVFGLMLFACFIPFQAVLIPMARVLGIFGLSNTTSGLVFVHVVYGLGFTTLFFRNYYEAFPDELIKAAMMDGAGFFKIFWRILLPSSGPIIVVTVIYQFTNIWND
ncbi:MAG: carbohydrate ABC transporter permease, partial [Pseudorhizobium sp.]